jgi:hypothetical protein
MSWIHSSRGAVIGVLAVLLFAAVGTAAAVTVDGSSPAPAKVGESVEYTATLEEPFRDAPDQWTLQGSTALENASWTVQVSAQGDPVETIDSGGDNFTYDLDSTTGATQVEITVTGDVQPIDDFVYADQSSENHTVLTVARLSDGNENVLASFVGPRYTAASQEARTAIDAAIEANDGRTDKVDQAISAYDNENFENAVALAEEAESGAQSSQLILYAVIAIVVLAVIGGGIYYWRQQQDQGYKLQ